MQHQRFTNRQRNDKPPPPGQSLKDHSSMVENMTSIFRDKIQMKAEKNYNCAITMKVKMTEYYNNFGILQYFVKNRKTQLCDLNKN